MSLLFFTLLGSLLMVQEIPFEKVPIMCFSLGDDTQVVINSQAEYQLLKRNKSDHPDCSGYELPELDLVNHTLLGYRTSTGGCSPPDYEIDYFQKEDGFHLKVIITSYGICRVARFKTHWVLVPKVNPGLVHFESAEALWNENATEK